MLRTINQSKAWPVFSCFNPVITNLNGRRNRAFVFLVVGFEPKNQPRPLLKLICWFPLLIFLLPLASFSQQDTSGLAQSANPQDTSGRHRFHLLSSHDSIDIIDIGLHILHPRTIRFAKRGKFMHQRYHPCNTPCKRVLPFRLLATSHSIPHKRPMQIFPAY